MTMSEIQNLCLSIRDQYADANRTNELKEWSARDYVDGLTINVADLTRMLMIEDGLRAGEYSRENIAHELMDIVWSAFVIADELGIDLANELPGQIESLRSRFD